VLLDQRMPGMDGLETLRHIKRRQRSARVVMSTAYASIELAVDALKLGATDFVRKPMTPEILRNAVAAALSKEAHVFDFASPAPQEFPAGPLIQTITMNGFTILDSEGSQQAPDERRFIVKSPGGDKHEILVQIDEEALGYVERMTRRRLPSESSFWTTQAQRHLSDYLWKEGKVPPTGKLTVKDIDRDELPIAARW
jgi:DNA-binding NarL/FixJ family response regulator